MTVIRIPTPLRAYTGGEKEVDARGSDVAAALEDLTAHFPELRTHLYNGDGRLRDYVIVFVNDRDMRELDGLSTALTDRDRIGIVPSIAGGIDDARLEAVDHAALRANQAVIIGLLAAAFVADAPLLAVLVGILMLLGSLRRIPGFRGVYRLLVRVRWLRPDVLQDHPEPHRFAQLLGALVLLAGAAFFAAGAPAIGWALSGVVAALAALNLFAGVCIGCMLYYWLARLHLRGFSKTPPPGTRPGHRPAG
jgi:molybdopterin converting factor small subunit